MRHAKPKEILDGYLSTYCAQPSREIFFTCIRTKEIVMAESVQIQFKNDTITNLSGNLTPITVTVNGTLTVNYNSDNSVASVSGTLTATDANGSEVYGPFSGIYNTNNGVYQLSASGQSDPLHDAMLFQYQGEQPSSVTNFDVSKGGNSYSTTANEPVTSTMACFASGTIFYTIGGELAVEKLAVGDLILTSSNAHRRIRWLGHRIVNCRDHSHPQEALPIRISAHAFGESRPSRDLFVSPGHSICVDVLGEVLIPAGALVNGSTVQQVEVDAVTYWHVELDSHDVILAENLPAESYLDMGNRGFFKEADVVDLAACPDANPAQRTHADFCRPFVDGGPILDAVKAQLRRRAESLGWTHSDALEMHLVVDGRRLYPVVRGLTARFEVPAEAKDVWLEAPTARPCDAMKSHDSRDLGVFIKALRIDDGFEVRDIAIDDPLLCIGFHPIEEGSQRWTAGRARLPAVLWEGCEDSFYLRVELAGMPLPRWVAPTVEADRPLLAIVA